MDELETVLRAVEQALSALENGDCAADLQGFSRINSQIVMGVRALSNARDELNKEIQLLLDQQADDEDFNDPYDSQNIPEGK